jgi:hypothetical protein
MTKTPEQMKREIMTRVRFVYYGRKILNQATVKGLAMFAMAIASTFFFSVSHVISNLMSIHVSDVYSFSVSAFSHTSFVVQAFTLGIAFLAVFFVKDVFSLARQEGSDLQFN